MASQDITNWTIAAVQNIAATPCIRGKALSTTMRVAGLTDALNIEPMDP